ncbi:non-specific lipid transfer protein GPI-anchored 14-like isoform X2 [Actinidia eriantha]|uniref:non-specific lipid transfer protein GPI-anchored 14-like isoform X2 n=1 Tax=Actinidia eriantha TaxID=165200 RepID=UPI00258D0473|nr:non-specific lipid transfer protein GPI-anchored 14-like isoform X2 [Actinidia eriantha]
MGSKCVTCILVLMMVGLASSDLAKDRQECADQLVGLATCLPYVSGEAKAPPLDCCSGLKQVLKDSKKCLCILVKDRNDPSLGLKINATLALSLPTTCHAPANLSECPALLHLAPNSTDAKVFEDFDNISKGSNSTTPATNGNSTSNGSTSPAEVKSDGGRGKRWLLVEMVCVAIFSMVIHTLLNM